MNLTVVALTLKGAVVVLSSRTYIFWLHYGFEVIEGDLPMVPHRPLENFLEPSQVFSGQLISFSRIGN